MRTALRHHSERNGRVTVRRCARDYGHAHVVTFATTCLQTSIMSSTTDDANTSPEVMLQFYRMLYPFNSIFSWLNHEHVPTKLFTHREFSFTLQGDVYLRYHSFNTAEDLKKQVLALNPTRFEIGPVYSAKVRVLIGRGEIRN